MPLTRLPGDEERSKQNRAKLMQQALEQAKKQGQGDSGAMTCEDDGSCSFGFQAAVLNAEKQGSVQRKDNNKDRKKAKSLKDVFALAKHMLK